MTTKVYLLNALALILLLAAVLSAQQTARPAFDAELAKKLGGDKNGMKSYVLAILKTGPKDAEIKGKEREELFKGHMANINRLAEEGKLAVAGPFGKNDLTFRGLFIFNVSSVEEARKLAETDPVIRAGVMVIDLVPWYGSAAMMQVNETHKKIAQSGM